MATPELKFKVTAETEKAAQHVSQLGEKVVTGMKGASAATEAFSKILAAIENNTKTAAKGFDELGKSIGKVREKPPVDPKPVERFTGTIGVLVGRLPKLRDALLRATDPKQIERLNKIIGDTDARIRQLTGASQRGAGGLGQFSNATGKANTTLVNFGRVVQDAPFGIIGIANNIDPLISSFQNLQKETGSTGKAFKSLLAGLAGPAGIAIAVSAVTSALIAFGPEIGRALSGVSALENELRNAAQEGAKEFKKAGDEFGRFSNIINDSNTSYARQKDTLKDINGLLADYGLKIKDVATFQRIGNQVGLLYAEIKQQEARSLALSAKAAEEFAKTVAFAIKGEQGDAFGVLGDLSFANKLRVAFGGIAGGANAIANQFNKLAANESQYTKESEKARDATEELRKKLLQIPGVVEDFGEKTTTATTAQTKLNAAWDAAIGSTDRLRASYQGLANDLSRTTLLAREAEKQLAKTQAKDIADTFSQIQSAGRGFQDRLPTSAGPSNAAVEARTNAQKALDDTKAQIEQITTLVGGTLNSVLTDTFNAIANGQSPIKSITNALKQLVVRLLAAAAAAALLNAFLGGTGVGAAAVNGGSFKNIFAGFLGIKLARGGVVSGPTPALIGEGGPEAVIPLSQLGRIFGMMGDRQDGPLVAVARGNDLYFANQRAGASYSRLFG